MNIMINNYCNLKCPYCFAPRDSNGFENITDENFNFFINFIKRSNFPSLRILGGEPTLHPQFANFVIKGLNDMFFREVFIFTNALALTPELSDVIVHPKLKFLINLNSPELIGESNYNKTISNIHYLVNTYRYRGLKPTVTLGINIFEPNFKYDYIVNATRDLNLEAIRYSITVPTEAGMNLNLDHYRQFIPRMLEFFDVCYNYRIKTHSDCNFVPKCLFTNEQLINLITSNHDIIQRNRCSPVMDVHPNLDVARCFPFTNLTTVKLKNFFDIKELSSYFYKLIDSKAFVQPPYDECSDCRFFEEKKCQAGCLSHRNKSVFTCCS